MYKHLYSKFLAARPGLLHCAAHSHYYWPDVTREAQLAYWDDAAAYADDKWDVIFGERVPAVQKLIANHLRLSDPERIVFAPNTHEFVYRLFSCLGGGDSATDTVRILTTDSEFHSFNRQLRRIEERGNVEVTRVPTEPFETLESRWQAAVAATEYDMIFTSQVFFNSGVAAPSVASWLSRVKSNKTLLVVDGYHGFGALPTDWSAYEDRIFYIAGGYKYAQGGEGACFMVVPTQTSQRPEFTGWFADFASLAKPQEGPVGYADNGFRFAGSTMDFSALYRLEAALTMWQAQGLSVERINEYIGSLQKAFLRHIESLNHPLLNTNRLLRCEALGHGHFYTFKLDSADAVNELAAKLRQQGVATDYRYDRLRFGFALYHDASDYQCIVG